MIQKTNSLVVILLVFIVASCKTIYRPNLAQVPVLKEKGDANVDVLIGSNGGELQIAYALTDNWTLVGSGVYNVSKATVMDTLYGVKDGSSNYSNYSGELGLGYYKWLRQDTTYCIALYGGGGYGKTAGYSDIWYAPDFVSYRSSYYKIFWQPTFTISKPYVDLSFAGRFRFLSYTSLNTSRGDSFATGIDTYVEPMIALKVGGDQFKLHLQVGTSFPFQNQKNYTASRLLFSVGFHLNFIKQTRDDYYFD